LTCLCGSPSCPQGAERTPPRDPETEAAIERVRLWAHYPYTTGDQIAVRSEVSTFTAGDLRLILAALP
jgi:hypothetical protein